MYDKPRDERSDVLAARGMARSFVNYEGAVGGRKQVLFEKLFDRLPRSGATIVEIGPGYFPNAKFFMGSGVPRTLEWIGVDPNDGVESVVMDAAKRADLTENGKSVRVVHGVAEALPLESGVADAVVSTFTLSCVTDPTQAVAEVKRVLKPGGTFLFFEPVLCETDEKLANAQRKVIRSDGCRVDRRTLETIKAAGFKQVESSYFELTGLFIFNPTVAGLATA